MNKGYQHILIYILVLLCSGCKVTLHKDYAFTEPQLQAGMVTIHGKLRGTMKRIDKRLTTTGSPYELLLWFIINGEVAGSSCTVELNEITLKDVQNDGVIFVKAADSAVIKRKRDGSRIGNFLIKNLPLNYTEHQLGFSYHISGGCIAMEPLDRVNFTFATDYKERKISFWDTLMGV